MAGKKQYAMDFLLNAQLNGGFSSTFSKAQYEFARLGKEIQSVNRLQADVAAYQKQQKAVENTTAKLENLKKQYGLLQTEIDGASGSTAALEREKLKLEQRIGTSTTALENQKRRLEATGARLREAGIDTADLSAAEAELAGETKRLAAEQEKAADSAKRFGERGAEAFSAVGDALTAAGVGTALQEMYRYLTDCTEAAIAYEDAATGVFKTVDGTEAQLAEISEGIREMSVNDLPATAEEIAAVAESAGQLGVATEDVLSFSRVMLDLGESTNLTAEEAATSFAKIANITGTAAGNYSRLGSVVVALGNNMATTEADITAMTNRLASAGTLAGLTEAEIMALSAAMSSVGIEAEAGGTAMTETLSAIEAAVVRGGDSLSRFAEVADMSAADFAHAWQTSPITAIEAFITGIGQLESRGESAVLVLDEMGLSGVRQSNMLKSLGLAAEQLSGAVSLANTAWEENTALTEEAGKRYATTASQQAMVENAYKNLQVTIGEQFLPELRALYGLQGDVLKGLTQFVKENPGLVKGITAAATAVGAVTAAVTAYNAVAKIAKALDLAAMFTGPVGAVTLAVGAIAGVVGAVAGYVAEVDAATVSVDELTEASRAAEEAMAGISADFQDAMLETQATADVAGGYIERLEELEAAYGAGASETDAYRNTLSLLCQTIPELSAYIDAQTGAIEGGTQALWEQVEAWRVNAEAQLYQEAYNELQSQYNKVLTEQKKLELEKEAASIRLFNAQTRKTEIEERLLELGDQAVEQANREYELYDRVVDPLSLLTDEYHDLEHELATVNETVSEEAANVNTYNRAMQESADVVADAETALASYETAVDGQIEKAQEAAEAQDALTAAQQTTAEQTVLVEDAITGVTGELTALAEAYTAAYGAALSSVQGQYALWDEAAAVVPQSVGQVTAALQEQASYWQEYNANLQSLTARSADIAGLRDMIGSFADGSPESVNMIAGLANATDEEVRGMVKEWRELQREQDRVSDSIAELQTDFSARMQEMQASVEDSIEDMDLSEEAARNGTATMQAYVKSLTDELPAVRRAANNISAAMTAALRTASAYTPVPVPNRRAAGGSIEGYADGTQNAEPGFKMVGEHGPELVYFGGGETVLNAVETAALQRRTALPTHRVEPVAAVPTARRGSNVQILLRIEGNATPDTVRALEAYRDTLVEQVMEALRAEEEDKVRGRFAL